MSVSSSLRRQLRESLSSIPLGNELADLLDTFGTSASVTEAIASAATAAGTLVTTLRNDLVSTVAAKGASLIGIEAGTFEGEGPTNVQAFIEFLLTQLRSKDDLDSTDEDRGASYIGVEDATITGNPATVQAALELLQARLVVLETP